MLNGTGIASADTAFMKLWMMVLRKYLRKLQQMSITVNNNSLHAHAQVLRVYKGWDLQGCFANQGCGKASQTEKEQDLK